MVCVFIVLPFCRNSTTRAGVGKGYYLIGAGRIYQILTYVVTPYEACAAPGSTITIFDDLHAERFRNRFAIPDYPPSNF